MNPTPSAPPPLPTKRRTTGWAITWFIAGFVTACVLVIGGEAAMFYYFTSKMKDLRKEIGVAAPPVPRAATKAEMHLVMARPDGSLLNLSSLKGRVIVLNVWATWCPPCMQELPSLAALAKHYADTKDVQVVCVTTEPSEDVWPKMSRHEAASLLWGTDRQRLPKIYETRAIPATFVINRAGYIVFQHVGMANWSSPETIQFIDSLR